MDGQPECCAEWPPHRYQSIEGEGARCFECGSIWRREWKRVSPAPRPGGEHVERADEPSALGSGDGADHARTGDALYREPFLWWHPGRHSGDVCVGGTRVPAWVVYDRYMAERDLPAAAEAFDITQAQADLCIEWVSRSKRKPVQPEPDQEREQNKGGE